jgi:hypothetical protein
VIEVGIGPASAEHATALNNLGLTLVGLGETAAARPLFARALSIVENAVPVDERTREVVATNLASTSGH